MDRYPTTDRAECPVCHWKYSRTHGEPKTCPNCDRAARMPALESVLKSNSDLKKPAPNFAEASIDDND